LSQFKKKYNPAGNLNFDYLDIVQSLKLRFSMEKILSISLYLNFTANTLDCYGLSEEETTVVNNDFLRCVRRVAGREDPAGPCPG